MDYMFNRRDFLKSMGLGAASLALPGMVLVKNTPQDKPNIVFILIDDMGWTDVGFMGSAFFETPNIDRLAGFGMVFSNAYAPAPNCAPARASMLSGQYTPRHGVYTVYPSARGESRFRKLIPIKTKRILDSDVVTIAEALKPAGYVSASIGKWHLGDDPEHRPVSQGFDVNIGGNLAGGTRTHFSPYNIKNLKDGPDGEYLTDRLTNEALSFIETNKEKPFFLYLPHYAVHAPFQAKNEMVEKYRKKLAGSGEHHPKLPDYGAMVESVDQSVGRIMDKLDKLDLTENTVVFFFSDNGGGSANVNSMEPLRGVKGMLYEGGIRDPLIVSWQGRIKPGSTCDTPVIGVDFYPTILEMAGVPKPPGHILDGESLMPLLTQSGSLKRKCIFWHFPAYLQTARGSKVPWRTTPASAVRQGNWKLIEFFEDGRLELYNLKDDIGEKNNLADKMPEKAKELHRVLVEWRKSVNAPVPTELNPEYDPMAKL